MAPGSSLLPCLMLLLTCSILFGCAGGTPLYPGERRAPEEVALLRPDSRATIREFDGAEVSGNSFEILPGPHELRFKVLLKGDDLNIHGFEGMRVSAQCQAKFVAEAGHLYRIKKAAVKLGASESNVAARMRHFDAGEVAILDWLEEGRPSVGQVACGEYGQATR